MNTWRHPNTRLRYVLAEAGWTEQELATAVNAAGAEIGVRLSYDRTTVAHWLSGTRPRPPTPDLLAEVFSRRLARQVTAAELGLAAESRDGADGADSPSQRPRNGDIGSVLIGLHASARPQAASMPAYSLADLELPGWPEAADVPPARRFAGRRSVTVADMDAAEHLARVLAADDAAFGGGHVRRATAAYLAADLAPRLYSRMSTATRRRLFAVATQLSYLCGFMCFDDQLHGLSQRYYRTALRLAAENGDQAGYVIALRAMSVQAYSLGHRRHARNLAETAASGARRIGSPRRQAFLYGQLAVARAADGDRAGALASMADAERRLDQATSASQLTGAYHLASLAHQQAVVQDFLGDRHGAITALDASIRHRPDDERRSRAITLALLADLQLSAGYLDEAVSTWHLFLDDYPYLDSGRATAELRRLRSRVRPLTRNAMARTLLQRASAYT
jgi:transcriptional regulator with XRE-family HTH domain